MAEQALLNKDAIRAMRKSTTAVELGTFSTKIPKSLMTEYNDLKKQMTESNIPLYPRDQIVHDTLKLINELMREDLENAGKK